MEHPEYKPGYLTADPLQSIYVAFSQNTEENFFPYHVLECIYKLNKW